MTNLIKAHRATGIEVGRTDEYVLVQTAPGPGTVQALRIVATQPATLDDVRLQITFELFDLIEKARFLGLDAETIQSLVTKELESK
jgi:hypothetical protein